MASPFKGPRTGIRRVVPAALRPFFNGGSSDYKRTLDTRDTDEARQRYYPHAVVYEQKLGALEFGAFQYANGLTDDATGARYDFGSLPSLYDPRDHASRITCCPWFPISRLCPGWKPAAGCCFADPRSGRVADCDCCLGE